MVLNWPAILNLITYASSCSTLLPLVFFLLFKKNNNEKTLKVIFYYVLYCILNEILIYFLHCIGIKNDNILFATFTILEFSFFCLFYKYALPTRLVGKIIIPIWWLFTIFALGDFFLINKMNSFDSIASGIESIFIILLCIYYLVVQLKGVNNLFVYSTSNFWIIITFLIYLSGTFFLYIMAENMTKNRNFIFQYIIINSVFNILKNILLSVAMLMKPAPTENNQQKNVEWDDFLSHRLNN